MTDARVIKERQRSQRYYRTMLGYLYSRHRDMRKRVAGKPDGGGKSCPWLGMECCGRDEFVEWALAHPEFIKLHTNWMNDNYSRRLAPSVHRKDRTRGYTLDNIQWITQQANSIEALSRKASDEC